MGGRGLLRAAGPLIIVLAIGCSPYAEMAIDSTGDLSETSGSTGTSEPSAIRAMPCTPAIAATRVSSRPSRQVARATTAAARCVTSPLRATASRGRSAFRSRSTHRAAGSRSASAGFSRTRTAFGPLPVGLEERLDRGGREHRLRTVPSTPLRPASGATRPPASGASRCGTAIARARPANGSSARGFR